MTTTLYRHQSTFRGSVKTWRDCQAREDVKQQLHDLQARGGLGLGVVRIAVLNRVAENHSKTCCMPCEACEILWKARRSTISEDLKARTAPRPRGEGVVLMHSNLQ